MPAAVAPGIDTGTEKVQLAPGANSPPVNVIREVPERLEDAPHTLDVGRPEAVAPLTIASRSSVKLMLVTVLDVDWLVIVKLSVVLFPATTGSVRKDFEISRKAASTTRSVCAGSPVTFVPLADADTMDVDVPNVPDEALAGTTTVTSNVQLSPAAIVPPVRNEKLPVV